MKSRRRTPRADPAPIVVPHPAAARRQRAQRLAISATAAAVAVLTFVMVETGLVVRIAAGGLLVALVALTAMAIGAVRRRTVQRWDAMLGWRRLALDPSRRWPWDGLPGRAANAGPAARLIFAVEGTVDGCPVTAGSLQWTRGAVGGLSRRSVGRGMFVILRLAEPHPTMAIWPHPDIPGLSARGRFAERYAIVADGIPDVYGNTALHDAHVAGEVPPWALVGDELLAIRETHRIAPAPSAALTLAHGLIRVADLLDIGPAAAS